MKLSLACKIIEVEDIIRCSFDINKTQYSLLSHLAEADSAETVSEISRAMRKDRTTIQKAIGVLFSKSLVLRKQVNLDNGGYIYYYYIHNKKKLKERIVELIDVWANSAKKTILHWK